MLEAKDRKPITIEFLKSIAFIKRVPLDKTAETIQGSLKLATSEPFVNIIKEFYKEFTNVLPSEIPGFLDQMKEKVSQVEMLNPKSRFNEPLGNFYPRYAVELAIDAVWYQLSLIHSH